jgi:O-acetyl-ADP-ribose deacetylase (regulator of RNase III)
MPVSFVEGDLLEQKVDAIVNAWNRNIIPWWLLIPQGVSGAIKRRAGHTPFRELGYRPLPLGAARHTRAGRLPFRGISHVAAIDMLWRASADSIRRSARAACELAIVHGYRTLAMPVLGSGSGGFPEDAAAVEIGRALADTHQIAITVVRYRSDGGVR